MAIRRCPYCKAIIDEGSEYCSNCGTQLLFPEDEYIHEDIPGEKIVEEDTPEENTAKKKRSSSRRRKKKEPEESGPVEAKEEIDAEQPEEAADVIELGPTVQETEEELPEEKIAIEVNEITETVDKDETEIPQMEDESPHEEKPAEEGNRNIPEEKRDEYFVEKQTPAFRTEDLEKVIDPEEKEKAEIEKFLKSLKEDRDDWDGDIPPTDELPPWAEKIKDEKPDETPAPDAGSEEEIQKIVETREELPVNEQETAEEGTIGEEQPVEESPPEGEDVKEVEEEILEPVGVTPEDEVPDVRIPEEEVAKEEVTEEEIPGEEVLEETAPDHETVMPDTGMGLPEGVEQENLPFADSVAAESTVEEKSPPSRLSTWLKSRAFDVLFIAAFWIVALHIASRMLSTNLFKLISASVLPSVAFYLALLVVYLFLFFLFLGQTLGDHLFPHEE